MRNELDAFIAAFRFDPERAMWSHVEGLKEDMESEDPDVRKRAGVEVSRMLEWLLKPRTAVEVSESISEQRESVRAKLAAAGMPEHVIKAAVKAVRVRQRGRPRSRNFDAIDGLRMYWLEKKSSRQIVLELNGSCKDRGCKSYCTECEDVWRKTVQGRLGGKRRPAAKCAKCKFRLRPPEQKESVCYKCADRMAELIRRLEAFLAECDIRPPRPLDE